MIVLVNFNTYLGGGETIFVRIAEHFSKINIQFKLFYSANSYIADDVNRLNIHKEHLCPYSGPVDYFYLKRKDKDRLVNHFISNLIDEKSIRTVNFCARDLYTLIDVAKSLCLMTITHLILHDEDNLYLGQSLVDKIIYKFFKIRNFSNCDNICFNNAVFDQLNKACALIGEKETTRIIMRKYGVDISDEHIVPPPMYNFDSNPPHVSKNKRILWLGRFVDFKLPAIVSMLEFVSSHKDYTLTLIGDGDIDYINSVVKKRKLNISNVHFLGQQQYDKIGDIIKQHSIGYASGTSIIEIGRYGLPVITALNSKTHHPFKRSICGGLYHNKYKGNEGNNLLVGETEDEQPTIEETINLINADFNEACIKSYQAMKTDFDFTLNVNQYLKIINKSERINFSELSIPICSIVRKLAFNIFK